MEDFVEPGMHTTWLVNDTEAFTLDPKPTSIQDRVLPLGLKYMEWYTLYFDILNVDQGRYKKWVEDNPIKALNTCAGEFQEKAAESLCRRGYPMLSRIRGRLYDAVFEADEVEQLRQECLRVQANTSNDVALHGLNKLLRICDWAQKLNLSIYLMCD